MSHRLATSHARSILATPVVASIGGITLGAIMFSVFLLFAGRNPLQIWMQIVEGGWGSKQAAAETLVKTIPIMLCALGAAVPARAGLINLGGDGQMIAGGIGAAGVALVLVDSPRITVLLAMSAAAIACAALWALMPALLKTVADANEAVASLLMNFVAVLLLQYLIHGLWRDPASRGWAQSAALPSSAMLPCLSGTRIHILLPIAILLSLTLGALLRWTVLDMSLQITRASPLVARYSGVNSKICIFAALLVGGACAGLAGLGEVSVIHGRLRDGLSVGYGYTGFLVAWLCGNKFLAIPIVSLLFGTLVTGADALQVVADLPFATVLVLQGAILLSVTAFQGATAYDSRSRMERMEGSRNG